MFYPFSSLTVCQDNWFGIDLHFAVLEFFFLSLFQLDSQRLCDSWPQGTWRTGMEAADSL